jgi:hypothetical protein
MIGAVVLITVSVFVYFSVRDVRVASPITPIAARHGLLAELSYREWSRFSGYSIADARQGYTPVFREHNGMTCVILQNNFTVFDVGGNPRYCFDHNSRLMTSHQNVE